jgi:prepilin peptidase CpaA
MDAPAVLAVMVAALAAAIDLHSRRIPNVLTFGGAATALLSLGFSDGLSGLGHGGAGWIIGIALFLPIFLLGGMGAGDVKLLGAVGAWLGPEQTVSCALYSVLAGGLIGACVAARRRYLYQAFENLRRLLTYWRRTGVQRAAGLTLDDSIGPRLAYGAAVFSGTVAALLV